MTLGAKLRFVEVLRCFLNPYADWYSFSTEDAVPATADSRVIPLNGGLYAHPSIS